MKVKLFESGNVLDVDELIESRMLICANAGGGKSYAVRKLLEETADKVMAIVLDTEGEFKTIREKYDQFLLIGGEESDVKISLEAAKLLPHKLLESNTSAIIDISDLNHSDQIRYVKAFLEALLELPQSLWKPCLVCLDEAHRFCGQQDKQESGPAVKELMSRGRKRGYCGILATQRLAKLHKDAVAEANNYMVGCTTLDVDQERAQDILGFTKNQGRTLRELKHEFWVFGPALSSEVKKEKIALVKSRHPKRGELAKFELGKPTPKLTQMLEKLSTLPQAARKQVKDLEEANKTIRELEGKLKMASFNSAKKLDEKEISRIKEQTKREIDIHYKKQIQAMEQNYKTVEQKLQSIGRILGQEIKKVEIKEVKTISHQGTGHSQPVKAEQQREETSRRNPDNLGDNIPLRAGAMNMLNWLAGASPASLTKQRLATLAGFSPNGGTFNTYISELKRNGWIQGSDPFNITEAGLQNATPQEIPSGDQLLSLWMGKFRQGAAQILKYLYDQYPSEVSKEDLGQATEFEPSGGTFNTYISELRRNGLIEISGSNLKISEEFFQ